MAEVARKKSPRFPSLALDDALERVGRVYDSERRHGVPADLAAQHIGYKNATSGAAMSALAALGYYGLLERSPDGRLAASKDVENYKFAPDQQVKDKLLVKWLRAPAVFSELLDKYFDGLPSDSAMKFELIQKGFLPQAADSCVQLFKRSVDFTNYYLLKAEQPTPVEVPLGSEGEEVADFELIHQPQQQSVVLAARPQKPSGQIMAEAVERIPVRLTGGRRAYLEVPDPFFAADKARIKAQIDLLLADDEEGEVP